MLRLGRGRFRHKKLKLALSTRPTSVRLRKTLFDILAHAPCFEPDDFFSEGRSLCFYDFFAGSGAVGLEILTSEPDSRAVFVEKDSQAIKALRANIKTLECEARCRVIRADAAREKILARSDGPGDSPGDSPGDFPPADVFFADPPYDQSHMAEKAVYQLARDGGLSPGAVVILQTLPDVTLSLEEPFDFIRRDICGKAASLSFWRFRA